MYLLSILGSVKLHGALDIVMVSYSVIYLLHLNSQFPSSSFIIHHSSVITTHYSLTIFSKFISPNSYLHLFIYFPFLLSVHLFWISQNWACYSIILHELLAFFWDFQVMEFEYQEVIFPFSGSFFLAHLSFWVFLETDFFELYFAYFWNFWCNNGV